MFENKEISRQYREEYRSSVKQLIQKMQAEGKRARLRWMPPERARDEQAFYREELKKLLGWPLTDAAPCKPPKMIIRESIELETHRMLRVQFEIFPDFLYYGLLYLPLSQSRPVPLIICQHGGQGTPELCSDLHGENNYSHVVQLLLKRDVAVFAPQMLLWCEDEEDKPCFPGYGLPYNRNETDAALRQLGGSLTALEVYCLMRSLDALTLREDIDPSHVAMMGLSYGGFYTQMMAALDTRIRSAHSSAYFCERETNCWPDWAWQDAALRMQDAEICALIAPRPLVIEMGLHDNKFDYRRTEEEFQRLVPYYEAHHALDKLTLAIVDTNHKYFDVETSIDRLIAGMDAV